MTTNTQARTGAWTPLRHRVFLALWLAQLGSNIGSWMQTVGGQWFLVERDANPLVVSLMQTANLGPALLLSLVAGVLADAWDRRRLLILTNVLAAAASIGLTVVAALGMLGAGGLLAFTVLIGAAVALGAPAWQAIQPDLVPREEIPAAAALGGVGVNVARAVGPALAGVLLALTTPAVVFGVNAASFVATAIVLLLWRSSPAAPLHPQPFWAAVRSGGRYVLSAPRVQRLLLRAAVFLVPASALWALLPLVASGRLGLGASGYGVLLGVLGVGALAGVALLPWLRTHLSLGAVLAASSLVFGIATAGSAVLGYLALAPLLALAGVAWIMTLSTVNAALQLTLPAWVRARGLSVYLLVMSGSQAIGAAAWGWVATVWGVPATLYVAAAALLVAALSLWWWPVLPGTAQLRRGISERLVDEPPAWASGSGRVWIDVAYVIDVADRDAVARILALETVRRRTGASQWYAVADADGAILRERYQFETWDEYARQERERLTDEDRALIDRAAAGATEVSTSVEFAVGQR